MKDKLLRREVEYLKQDLKEFKENYWELRLDFIALLQYHGLRISKKPSKTIIEKE